MDFSPYYRKILRASPSVTINGTQGDYVAGRYMTRLTLKPAVKRAIETWDDKFQSALSRVELGLNHLKAIEFFEWFVDGNIYRNLVVLMVTVVVMYLAIYWVTSMKRNDDIEEIIQGPKFWIKQDQKTLGVVKHVCQFLARHRMWFPRLNFVFVQIQPGHRPLHQNTYGLRDGGLSAPPETSPPGTPPLQADSLSGEIATYYNIEHMWADERCINEVTCEMDNGALSSAVDLDQGPPVVVGRSSSLPNAMNLSTRFMDYPLYGPLSLSLLSQLVSAPATAVPKKRSLTRKRRRGASLCPFPLVPITEVIDEAVDYEYETTKRYLTPPRLRGNQEGEKQNQQQQQAPVHKSQICHVSPWVHRNYYQPVWLYRGRRTDDRNSLAMIQDETTAIGRSGRCLLPDPQLSSDSGSSLSDASLTTASSATSQSTSNCSSPLSSLSLGPSSPNACSKTGDDCFNSGLSSNDQVEPCAVKPSISKTRLCLQKIADTFSIRRSNSNSHDKFVLQGRDRHC